MIDAKYFQNLGIDNVSEVHFCDNPRFVELSEKRPLYNEEFAAYINEQTYSKAYLERAETTIPIIVHTLWQELVSDGALNACARISLQLYRMLQEAGFWCYMMRGSLTIHINTNKKYEFYGLSLNSENTDTDKIAGHVWVVAPPFKLIDISVKQQEHLSTNPNISPYLLLKELSYCNYNLEDIVSPALLEKCKQDGWGIKDLYCDREGWDFFSKHFRPFNIHKNNIEFHYTPLNCYVISDKLNEIYWQCNGHNAQYIYKNLILPQIDTH